MPSGGGIPVGVHFTPTLNERRGHQMIVGPGAALTFSREGYKFWDVRLRDVVDSVTNIGLLKFALSNPSLSIGEVWKDLNKRAFLREAQKLMPSLTEDMVEVSPLARRRRRPVPPPPARPGSAHAPDAPASHRRSHSRAS